MSTFAELAVEMKLFAQREAHGVEALEILTVQSRGELVFQNTLCSAKCSAERAAEAYRLFKALIPYEDQVRQLANEESQT